MPIINAKKSLDTHYRNCRLNLFCRCVHKQELHRISNYKIKQALKFFFSFVGPPFNTSLFILILFNTNILIYIALFIRSPSKSSSKTFCFSFFDCIGIKFAFTRGYINSIVLLVKRKMIYLFACF